MNESARSLCGTAAIPADLVESMGLKERRPVGRCSLQLVASASCATRSGRVGAGRGRTGGGRVAAGRGQEAALETVAGVAAHPFHVAVRAAEADEVAGDRAGGADAALVHVDRDRAL